MNEFELDDFIDYDLENEMYLREKYEGLTTEEIEDLQIDERTRKDQYEVIMSSMYD